MSNPLDLLLILLIGFSIVSAAVLLVTYSVIYRNLNKSLLSIVTAATLLVIFALEQWLHLKFLSSGHSVLSSKVYSTLVLLSSPMFYLFVSEYINLRHAVSHRTLLHFVPLLINLLIPDSWSIPLAFLIGSGYAAVLCQSLYKLRNERVRFEFELLSLSFFLVIAIAVFLLGLSAPFIGEYFFVAVYSLLVSCSFLLVMTSLLVFPDIAINLNEAMESRYAKSTLGNVHRNELLASLEELMSVDKLSRNETLNLAMLAEHSGHTPHQVSELVNTEFGYGVSRYIREHRIRDAKEMLLDEPDSSILSVSLATGFSSQSTFYAAFNQIVGLSPGNYRKTAMRSPK